MQLDSCTLLERATNQLDELRREAARERLISELTHSTSGVTAWTVKALVSRTFGLINRPAFAVG
jgi:hypothetical protein